MLWLLSIAQILYILKVITSNNTSNCVVSLLIVFIIMGIILYIYTYHLVGILYLLIYGGALTIIFVFSIMLNNN